MTVALWANNVPVDQPCVICMIDRFLSSKTCKTNLGFFGLFWKKTTCSVTKETC